MAVIPETH